MAEGFTSNLVATACIIAVLSALVAWRDLPPLWAVAVAAARVAVPLFYFAWYDTGQWTMLDDMTYFSHGDIVLDKGYSPLTVLLDPGGIEFLSSINGGHHILYSWWNVLAVWLFGSHYYAPVFLNVLASFVMGWLLVRTAKKLGLAPGYCKWLLLFFLIHWDTVSWASFVNLKDILVELLTVAGLYCALCLFQERRIRWLVGLAAVSFLFYWIRFYVPLLMAGAIGLWVFWQWSDPRKLIVVPLAIVAANMPIPALSQYTDMMSVKSFATDLIRFTLTPLPWSIEPSHTFLTVPSVLHWLMFLPAVIGVYQLWRDVPGARLYMIYLAATIALYATTDELLGPRQRVQVAFIFVWLQFHFLRHALRLPIWQAARPALAEKPRTTTRIDQAEAPPTPTAPPIGRRLQLPLPASD